MSEESKVVVTFPSKNKRKVTVGDKSISVKPYISIAEQSFLIETFLNDCFNLEDDEKIFTLSPFDRFSGEFGFNMALLDRMTNLDVSKESPVDLDDVIRSGVFAKIVEKIDNYADVVSLRETILQDVIKERYSIVTMDDVKEMANAVKDLEEKIEKDSPLRGLFKEGNKNEGQEA